MGNTSCIYLAGIITQEFSSGLSSLRYSCVFLPVKEYLAQKIKRR